MPRTPVVTDGLVLELIGKYAKLGTVGGGPGNNTDPTNNWVSTLPGVGGAAGYFTFTEGDGWRGNGSESDPYALEWDGPHPGEERYYWFTITDYPAVYNSASYSWEVWLWCDNFTTGWMNAIIDFGGYTISGFRLGYNSSGMVYYWNSQNGGTLDTSSGYTAMKLNAWNHIVTTHNSGDNQYYNYVNGTQDNIGTTGTYVVPSSGGYLVLSPSFGAGAHDGRFSTVRGYNRALTPTEVAQNRNAGCHMSYLDNWKGLEVVRLVNG